MRITPHIHSPLSRCGMVYIDADELKWMPFVKTWIKNYEKRLKPETMEFLLMMFEKVVENGLQFVNKKCEQAINQVSLWIECFSNLQSYEIGLGISCL